MLSSATQNADLLNALVVKDPACGLKEEAAHVHEISDCDDLHVLSPHHAEPSSTVPGRG